MEKFIKNLALGAGAILREGFKKDFEIKDKGASWNVVTEYDLAAEDYITSRILKKFPSHGIVAEEGGERGSKKNFWIIDPLDGTRAFSRGLPQFTTCIAFVSGGIIRNAAIYDPMLDELFYAARGKGAYLNGERIFVSDADNIQHCMISMYFATGLNNKAAQKRTYNRYVESGMWSIKTGGCAQAMAYAAAGRTDAFVIQGASVWDRAPGALILKEAGAKVTDMKGRPYRWNSLSVVAANPVLHKKIMDTLELKKL